MPGFRRKKTFFCDNNIISFFFFKASSSYRDLPLPILSFNTDNHKMPADSVSIYSLSDTEHPVPNVTTTTGHRRQREDEEDDGDSSDHGRRKKKSRIQTLTWSHSRPPKASETARDRHYHEIWYCKHCDRYKTTNLKRARDHLRSIHRIYVKEEQSDNSKRQRGTIEDIIGKQVQPSYPPFP